MCQDQARQIIYLVSLTTLIILSACENPRTASIDLTETFEAELETRLSATSTAMARKTVTAEALATQIQEGIEATLTTVDYNVKITSPTVKLQNGPGGCHEQIASLQEEEIVSILGRVRNEGSSWYIIRTKTGLIGWLATNEVETLSQETIDNLPVASEIPPCPTPTSLPFSASTNTPFLTSTPLVGTTSSPTLTSEIIDVYNCRHIGGNRFEWYQAEIFYDENNVAVDEKILDGPVTGYWQPNCPPIPPTNEPPSYPGQPTPTSPYIYP